MTTCQHEITYNDMYREGQAIVNRIIWTIKDFKKFLSNNKTQEFQTKINKDHKDVEEDDEDVPISNLQLKIKILGSENDIMELYYLSHNTVFLNSSLTLIYGYNDERCIVQHHYKTVEANKWIYMYRLTKHQIENNFYNFVNKYKGNLILQFTFMTAQNITIESPYMLEGKLSNDLEDLLNGENFSDVTIKSADGSEYKVHKVIISSRSAVLKAHFTHNTTECNINIVESPFNADVLQEILTFMYSDRVPKIDEIPDKLLVAADFYQLRKLKAHCEESLRRKLTYENAIETLILADLHSAKYLKESTMEFIKNGNEKLITKSEGWLKLESAKQIKDIYEYIIFGDNRGDIKFV